MISTPCSPLRIAVVQDGARLHYAVPLALQRAGVLRFMFSEAFFPRESKLGSLLRRMRLAGNASIRGWLDRRCDELDPRLVRTNLSLVVRQQWSRRRISSDAQFYRWSSAATAQWIRRHGLGDASGLFGFIRNIDPSLLEMSRQNGLISVADQFIAPVVIEAAEACKQRQLWPGWSKLAVEGDESIVREIEERSWRSADRITCASDYVRRGLIEQGVDSDRIIVNPYPIEMGLGDANVTMHRAINSAIVVGFVGSVSLRKGAPYFWEVARRLKSARIKFVMVGPIDVSAHAEETLRQHIELVGRVGRAEVPKWLARFDMFLFPSTCEGSAGSVMEAMAAGLPIVTTPNSGTIVSDGIDGFVREYHDIDGLVSCVETLALDETMRKRMGSAAQEAAGVCNLTHFGAGLVNAFRASAGVR